MCDQSVATKTFIGRIQSFYSKGYGFILNFSDNQEYFFHISNVEMTNEKTKPIRLKKYEIVRFELSLTEDKKTVAVAVKPPYGFTFSFDTTKGTRVELSSLGEITVEDGIEYTGVVSSWNRVKKFGTIIPQEGIFKGLEIFVHLSEIKVSGFKFLKPFEAVRCKVGTVSNGVHIGKLVCVDVKAVDGLQLACQAVIKTVKTVTFKPELKETVAIDSE